MEQEQYLQNWGRVRHYMAVRQFEKAAAVAGEMVAARPEDTQARLLLIGALDGKGLNKEALQATRDLLAIDAENAVAWHWVAILAKKSNEKRLAIERALVLRPNSASFHAAKAWVLMKQMEMRPWISWREVEASARRALELNPEHREAHLYLSSALLWKNRGEAREHCEYILRKNPEDAAALRKLAEIEKLDNRHRKAHTALTQSLQLDPTDKWAQFSLRTESTLARREDQRVAQLLFLSSLYDKVFGRLPAGLALSLFVIGVSLGLFRLFSYMYKLRDWKNLDTIAMVIGLFCCFVLQFAIRPYLKFVPARWLPDSVKKYGKQSEQI